ncbi:adenylate kinase 9-like [Agrilus planipennis]|uniref:Adenylate kinase 9-like n=1 Tax=Agrilus planipennis TaxID=224129 RepID=A0A7F5RJJ3_AGRPL|nr:adenylate kinase 9-like [Agrilus planipennis]
MMGVAGPGERHEGDKPNGGGALLGGDDDGDDDDDDEGDVGDIDHLSESTVVMPSKQEPPPDYGSLLGSICAPPYLEKNYEQQLDFIFNLFTPPFQIIYICCDHADVISRRNANRFDIYNGVIVNKQDEEMEQMFFDNVYFPLNQEDVPEDIFAATKLRLFNYQSTFPQHLLRLPSDFPANVSVQLGRYYTSAMPIMECYILAHDPEYYLRVDGRLTPSAMFSAIKTRIRIMPFQKVIVPEKIIQPELYFGGENEPIPDDEDFKGMTPEDVYDDFRKRRIVAPLYKWTWSDWNSKCPVAMKESEIKDGTADLAVHFFNKLFFLSTEDAVTKFTRNPRPFLLPPYPKPSCRIFVMGPKCSECHRKRTSNPKSNR